MVGVPRPLRVRDSLPGVRGGYTLSPSGYHRACAKVAGLATTRRAS